jgi:hypothetical protein
MRRTLVATLASVALAGLLAGCALLPNANRPRSDETTDSPSGQLRSSDDAVEAIEAVPGVTARISPANDGSTPYLAVNLEFDETFAAAFPPDDPDRDATFLDFVIAQVWSQTENAPNRFVTLRVTGADRDAAWVTDTLATIDVVTIPFGGQVVSLRGTDLRARYGSWPGEVPTLPAALGGTG